MKKLLAIMLACALSIGGLCACSDSDEDSDDDEDKKSAAVETIDDEKKPAKEKKAVKGFDPVSYGALVAQMAKTESGKKRKFTEVGLIVNQNDYLTKIMPATTVLNANGVFVNDLFPIPTTVYISNVLEDGDAVLFLKNEYFMGMGGEKNAVIEYSDEYKFIEDMRYFKVKQYGAGRAFDNTSALYLDITGLEPAYITVKDVTPTA